MATSGGALSVLTVDVSDAEGLANGLDRQEVQYVLGRCEKRIRQTLVRHGGRVVHRAGGNLTAFFADGGEALQSAIEMQQRVAEMPRYASLPLVMRVGICSGHRIGEAHYFSGNGPNPASSLAALADPAHILLSLPRRLNVFPRLLSAVDGALNWPLSCGKRRLDICQIAWQGSHPAAAQAALSALGLEGGWLDLYYRGATQRIDALRPSLSLGRQPGSGITLLDPRCSREHGSIERRFDRFFYVDHSTNGSYLVLDDQAELFVHRNEQALFGQGRIYLGAPSSAENVESIQFQVAPL